MPLSASNLAVPDTKDNSVLLVNLLPPALADLLSAPASVVSPDYLSTPPHPYLLIVSPSEYPKIVAALTQAGLVELVGEDGGGCGERTF